MQKEILVRRLIFLTIRFIVALASSSSLAQQDGSLFESHTFTYDNGRSMPYRLFVPRGYTASKKYPLILWLHGSAGRGNDNVRNISGGNKLGAQIWTLTSNQSKHPCFVVVPQCPDTAYWVSNDGIDKPPDQLDVAVNLLKELQGKFSLDTDRIYVAGQSMGGVATWEVISRYEKVFAAALPLCGIGNVRNAPKLTRIAIWAFHGDADEIVPVAQTREMVGAIRRAGGRPKYTEYKGVGHDVWNSAFKERDLVAWLFRQARNK